VSEAEVRLRTTAEHVNGGHTLNDTSYTCTFLTINTNGISSIIRKYNVLKDIISMISRSLLYGRPCKTTLLYFSIVKHTNISTDQCGLTVVTPAGVHYTQTDKFPSRRSITEWRNYTYGKNVSAHLGNSHQGDRNEFLTPAWHIYSDNYRRIAFLEETLIACSLRPITQTNTPPVRLLTT
jgi:hypothetical protein